MDTDVLRYEADGLRLVSHLYIPDPTGIPDPGGAKSGPESRRPGVLVFPEGTGLNEHAKSRAQRLANLGYVALACDLHGEGLELADISQAMGLLGPLRADPSRTRARARGGLQALQSRSEVDPAR